MVFTARLLGVTLALALSVACGGSSCPPPQQAAPAAAQPEPVPARSETLHQSVPDARAEDDLAGVDLATVEPRPLLRQWLLDLRREEASLSVAYGPAHPAMRTLRAEIEALAWADEHWDAWGGGVLALQFASLCRREARLSISYGDRHPTRAQVVAEKRVVSEEIAKVAAGAQPSCAAAE